MKNLLRLFAGWIGLIVILLLSTVLPALADGGGWPTATPTTAPVMVPDSNNPPVLVITPIGKNQPFTLEGKLNSEADPALAPQTNTQNPAGAPVVAAQSQESKQSSGSILIIGGGGLIICIGLVGFILLRMRKRG